MVARLDRNTLEYEHYLAFPLDRTTHCQDCGTKLDDGYGPEETLCGGCYETRLDDPCENCGAGGGVDCSWYCSSRLV